MLCDTFQQRILCCTNLSRNDLYTLLYRTSADPFATLSDIVKSRIGSEIFMLTVRRGYILEDTLRGIKRSTFDPLKRMKVGL